MSERASTSLDISPEIVSPEVVWIVCEDGSRWVETVRCFCLGGATNSVRVSVRIADEDEVLGLVNSLLRRPKRTVFVVWEMTPKTLAVKCRAITTLALTAPQILQIAAVTAIPMRYRSILSEFGATLQIRQPEEMQAIALRLNEQVLPGLARLR
ncbi:hypothetical protein CA13_32120 [Planctomycetes bacterium CA13]|uniref:Uncharacterized protein n=1 Tax=Novipirellula herctigrandis TaxID=2527986 RepID=A0A5C5Z301_9BACT|nr:hypothetical protein CA13_32120 [Planctomycetes bacterium CA13]